MRTDGRGAGLVGNGNQYTTVTATSTQVSSIAGARCVRLWSQSGTGSVNVYDNTSNNTTNPVFSLTTTTVGTVITLDIPMKNGLVVSVGATTTIVVVYEE